MSYFIEQAAGLYRTDAEIEAEKAVANSAYQWDQMNQGEYRVTDPVTGGMKNQKPAQLSLIPVEALKAVSRVYSFGAEKYDRNNWRLGYDWHLSYDALQRHLLSFWGGENTDPDSGESHLAHAAFHLFTLLTYQTEGLGNDDRA